MEAPIPQVIESPILAPLAVPAMEAVFAPVSDYAQAAKIVPYAAYDVGSGATKYMGALVNTENNTIEQIIHSGSVLVNYRQDLSESPTHDFSDLIQEMGLNALFTAKSEIEEAFAQHGLFEYGEIQHFAVATAAFREAQNGQLVASQFEQMLDFPIEIISQEEEGKLAYYGATAQVESDNAPVVWDIGGGSMQLTFKDSSDYFHIMQGTLASVTFNNLVNTSVMEQAITEVTYPMTTVDVDAAIDLAKQHLQFDQTTTDIIKQQIDNHSPVLAVGSLHNFSIKPLCDLAGSADKNHYTQQDVHQAITLLTDKSLEEVVAFTGLEPSYAKNALTNLILVYAMMEQMNIPHIDVVGVSNVQGLMLQKAITSKSVVAHQQPLMIDVNEPAFIF